MNRKIKILSVRLSTRIILSLMVVFLLSERKSTLAETYKHKKHHSPYKHKLYRSNLLIEGKISYGFIAAHHIGMEIYNSHLPSIEFSLIKETYGQNFWEQMFNYPNVGVTLWHSGLGSSSILGTATALFPHINFPLIQTQNTTFSFRLGAGIGYLSKTFHRLENYKHLAIGSHLNFAGNLMLELKFRAGNYWVISTSAALQHFSNGAFKLPNYGLNIPGIALGAAYRLDKKNTPIERRLYSPTKPFDFNVHRLIEFNMGGMVGFKNMAAIFGDRYYVYSIFGNAFKRVSYKSKFGVGFDVSYDGSDALILERDNIQFDKKTQLIKSGINLAYELTMGRLSFYFNYGFYLGGLERSDGTVYHKVSLRYDVTNNIFANITLKTHWGSADFIGWGLGYQIKTKY